MIATLQWTGTIMAVGGMLAVLGTVPVYASLRTFDRARRQRLMATQGIAMRVSLGGLALVLATGFMG